MLDALGWTAGLRDGCEAGLMLAQLRLGIFGEVVEKVAGRLGLGPAALDAARGRRADVRLLLPSIATSLGQRGKLNVQFLGLRNNKMRRRGDALGAANGPTRGCRAARAKGREIGGRREAECAPDPRSPFETNGGRVFGPRGCRSRHLQSRACSTRAGCPWADYRPCPWVSCPHPAGHHPAPVSFSSLGSAPGTEPASSCWAQTSRRILSTQSTSRSKLLSSALPNV